MEPKSVTKEALIFCNFYVGLLYNSPWKHSIIINKLQLGFRLPKYQVQCKPTTHYQTNTNSRTKSFPFGSRHLQHFDTVYKHNRSGTMASPHGKIQAKGHFDMIHGTRADKAVKSRLFLLP
jgi:hypothetical protein